MNSQDNTLIDPPINAADFGVPKEYLERAEHYANWRVQQEREACAKVCDEKAAGHEEDARFENDLDYKERFLVYAKHERKCAAAIRARGQS